MDLSAQHLAGSVAARSAAGGAEGLARSLEHAPAARAAAKFEQLFAALLVKEMRKALPEGFFGEGAGGDIYGGWFDEHLGGAIARSGALHLQPLVESGIAGATAARAYEEARALGGATAAPAASACTDGDATAGSAR